MRSLFGAAIHRRCALLIPSSSVLSQTKCDQCCNQPLPIGVMLKAMYATGVVPVRVQSTLVICACRGPQTGVDSLRGRDRAVAGLMAEYVRSEYQSASAFLVTLSRHEKWPPGASPTGSTMTYTANQWHHLDGRPASFPSLAVKPEEILWVCALQHQLN